MKLIVPISLSILLLSTISCESEPPKTEEKIIRNILVSASKIAATTTKASFSASGKILASNSANLSTRMMGFVKDIHVKTGDKVQKGQLLLSINNDDLAAKASQINASISEASAAFNNASTDYQRYQNLFNENSATQKELDDITTRYLMAEAKLKATREMKNEIIAQYEYTNIRAPFSGVITNLFIEVGDMANPGIPLIEIETQSNYEVKSLIPENKISHISLDTIVEVYISSVDKMISGKVKEISTSSKNTGGQFIVTVDLGKQEKDVLSGMFATIEFPLENSKNSNDLVLIPKESIFQKGELKGVYTITENNIALLRWLRLGKTYGDQIEVLSGLKAGETIVVDAQGKIYNGAKVEIKK